MSDIIARYSDGETRAGPFALAPGEARDCTWSQTVEHALDERVTVGGRGSDGRLVSAQTGAHVGLAEGGRPWWIYAALAAAVLAVLAIVLVVAGGGDGGGGGGGGSPDVRVFRVGTDVLDMDVRGDKAAFLAPVGAEQKMEIRRLDLASGTTEQVVAPAQNHNSVDVGLNAAGHARLVYTGCDEAGSCDVLTRPFNGREEPMRGSSEQCSEIRPTMYRGLILFARAGEGCTPALMLKPLGDAPPHPIAGQTAGSDLNDGAAIWLAGGTLFAKGIGQGGQETPQGQLKPDGGDRFQAPLVVEDGFAYFVHEQARRTSSRARSCRSATTRSSTTCPARTSRSRRRRRTTP